MTYSESHKRASMKYAKEKLKRIPLDVQINEYESIKQAADSVNEPVNTFIKNAIRMRLDAIAPSE